MTHVPTTHLDVWEAEGGAPECPRRTAASLSGTENQVEWAMRLKHQANQEFDRVAEALRVVSRRQQGQRRTHTGMIIDILEENLARLWRGDCIRRTARRYQRRSELL